MKMEFSCYSAVFKTHFRIDYFLVSASVLPKLSKCMYESIVLSDHAPTSLSYNTEQANRQLNIWRLHPKWLQNSDFLKFIGEKIDLYFSVISNQTSAAIRFEAFKAY